MSKIQAWLFLQIQLNSYQHLNPNNFFFPTKKGGAILRILTVFNRKF
jgi:hypothetical protein